MKDFLAKLTDDEVAEVVAAMKEVALEGHMSGKHLRGDIYEVKADAPTRSFRVLFAPEGQRKHVLLSLSAFVKKTQKTPTQELELAEQRLGDWRRRARRPRSKSR